jgi:pimeloyl-ACP methyl ester carboxylesterase
VNGVDLFVHVHRDEDAAPSGLTLLLVHGFLDAGATWDLVAAPLARAGHVVVAPDLRGFGRSGAIGAGGYYHFPDYVADVSALVEALAPGRLGVVGHSMGGTIATLFAGTFPERVERLAVLEGLGPIALPGDTAVERMRAWLRDLGRLERAPRPLASLDDALDRLALHHPRVPRDVLATRARLLTRTDAEGRLVWAYDPLHRTTSPTPFNVAGYQTFLDRIACPVLFVGGGPLGYHPPDEAERLACLRDVTIVELPEAGHMMHWTAPEALARRLVEFFA